MECGKIMMEVLICSIATETTRWAMEVHLGSQGKLPSKERVVIS